MVTISFHQSRSQELGDALMQEMLSKYSILECRIMDQDDAFMSTLINYSFKKLDIKIKTVTP